MSQARLYLDAMRRSLVFGLRARNVDVLTAAEADMINRQDEDHLTAAAGRALFTYNTADYCVLHQSWMNFQRAHAGIIVAQQQQYSVGEELRLISGIQPGKCRIGWSFSLPGFDVLLSGTLLK